MKAEIKDGVLHLAIPMNSAPVPSSSGKTLVVASSRGNKETEAEVSGQKVRIGVNAFIYPPR